MFSTLFSTQRRLRKAEIPALAMITPSPWRQAWRSLKRNRLAMFCLLLLAVMAAWCVLGPLWSPWKDDATDVLMINKPPGAEHWLGTDFLGRDVYTRLLMAGRISLIIGLLTMLLSVALGYLLGAVSGYAGGLTDKLIMRLADLVMTIPGLPLLIVAGAMLSELDFSPDARIYMVVVMLSLLEWPKLARLVRVNACRCANAISCWQPGCWASPRAVACLAICCPIPFRFWWSWRPWRWRMPF
jgi:peptide/nickel transport system permease protein